MTDTYRICEPGATFVLGDFGRGLGLPELDLYDDVYCDR
jgi:hypothetical protein